MLTSHRGIVRDRYIEKKRKRERPYVCLLVCVYVCVFVKAYACVSAWVCTNNIININITISINISPIVITCKGNIYNSNNNNMRDLLYL